MRIATRRWGLRLVSPWLVTLGVFWLFPLGYALTLSFSEFDLLSGAARWVGLENYRAIFADPAFHDALRNTLIFSVGTIPLTQLLALGLALLAHGEYPGRGVFRSAFFLPSVTSLVVVALIFSAFFSREGYVVWLCSLVGVTAPAHGFLLDSSTALYSIMAMDIWMASGFYMLLILAGLEAIPTELYEAARLAGASATRQFFSITLPLMRPMILFCIVINTIKSLQVFVEIFVMTKGKYDTSTAVWYVYDTGLVQFDFGLACAAAYTLFVVIAIISLLQFVVLRRPAVNVV